MVGAIRSRDQCPGWQLTLPCLQGNARQVSRLRRLAATHYGHVPVVEQASKHSSQSARGRPVSQSSAPIALLMHALHGRMISPQTTPTSLHFSQSRRLRTGGEAWNGEVRTATVTNPDASDSRNLNTTINRSEETLEARMLRPPQSYGGENGPPGLRTRPLARFRGCPPGSCFLVSPSISCHSTTLTGTIKRIKKLPLDPAACSANTCERVGERYCCRLATDRAISAPFGHAPRRLLTWRNGRVRALYCIWYRIHRRRDLARLRTSLGLQELVWVAGEGVDGLRPRRSLFNLPRTDWASPSG
jgi:hypothetical protein